MAEAFAILGAVSSIIQIVDFTAKLVGNTRELIKYGSIARKEMAEIEYLAREYEYMGGIISTARSEQRKAGVLSKDEDKIFELASRCEEEAQELLTLLGGLQVDPKATGWKRIKESTKAAAGLHRKQAEIETVRLRLRETNGLLNTAMLSARDSEHKSVYARLLQSLSFEGMQLRLDTIVEAYTDTYNWALLDDRFRLKPWLTSGNGVFWITGKAGSGKSTLMKYLETHQDTHELLKQWSGKLPLVRTNFFFWFLGTGMQKSTEGLLRSILHQMISETPALAKVLFSDCFDHKPDKYKPLRWDYKGLEKAVKRIASAKSGPLKDKKFFFFIDGLDEYDGDHLELVQLIDEMSKSLHVKLCVSSRPWTVFNEAFEDRVPMLRLEDVTRPDIALYTRENISRAINGRLTTYRRSRMTTGYDPDEIKALMQEITDKAEGVFLWVYLVVRYVVKGIGEGDKIPMLRRRVSAFSTDLEKFFKELVYNRVDPIYERQTSQALMLALMDARNALTIHSRSSFIDYWLISQEPDGLTNENFAYDLQAPRTNVQALRDMAEDTRIFLGAACKDLLVMDRPAQLDFSTGVSLLHRTVYDFLSLAEIHNSLVDRNPAFFKDEYIMWLFALARLKYMQLYDLRISEPAAKIVNAYLDCQRAPPGAFQKVYVDAVDSCMQRINQRKSVKLEANTICTLAAFHHHKLAREFLQQHPAYNQVDRPEDFLALVAASLGESDVNQFSFDEIDIDFMKELVQRSSFSTHRQKWRYNRKECYISGWQLLLRKWARTNEFHGVDNEDITWAAYEIAKVYLQGGAHGEELFCALCTPPSHDTHAWCTAADFLDAQVTNKWLLDQSRPILHPMHVKTVFIIDAYLKEQGLGHGRIRKFVPGHKQAFGMVAVGLNSNLLSNDSSWRFLPRRASVVRRSKPQSLDSAPAVVASNSSPRDDPEPHDWSNDFSFE